MCRNDGCYSEVGEGMSGCWPWERLPCLVRRGHTRSLIFHNLQRGCFSPHFTHPKRLHEPLASETCRNSLLASRDLCVHFTARLRRLKVVLGHILRQLPVLRPLPNIIIVPTYMLGVEVHEGERRLLRVCLYPNLSEDTKIDRTHELLPQNVETVG